MDPRGLQAHVDELMEQFQKLREGATELQNKIKAVTASAKSTDGYVKVTVGPRGQVISLDLDPRIYRDPNSAKLSAAIVDAIQRASKDAADQVAALCKPFMPEKDIRAHLDQDLDSMFTKMDHELFDEGGRR